MKARRFPVHGCAEYVCDGDSKHNAEKILIATCEYDIIILLLYYYVTLKQRISKDSAGTEPGGPTVFFNEKSYNTTYYYINIIKIIPMLWVL